MIISFMVAVSDNGVIGKDGKNPWRLPAEQQIFKKITMGHPIIMGRRTYQAIRRPLPGRTNIVVTHQKDLHAPGYEIAGSLKQALEIATQSEGAKEIFIIGGAEIFKQALPMINKIYLARVHAFIEGDTFFNFDESKWQEVKRTSHRADEANAYSFDFIILEPAEK